MIYKNRTERLSGDDIILAPIRRRLSAFIIDCIFIGILYFLVLTFFNLFSLNDLKINVKGIFDIDVETNIHNGILAVFIKILFGLLPVIYFTLFLYFSKGRTLGKYFLRIKVVSLYHERLGLWHCFERSIGYFTSALESGFGFIQAGWNPNRMALHDKIGETVVINIPRTKTIKPVKEKEEAEVASVDNEIH